MASRLNPYVNFRGRARAAAQFYQSVLGGSLQMDTFAGFGMPVDNPDEKDWIMHAQLDTPAGFTLMVSDTPSSMPLNAGGNVSISLSGDNDAELSGYWNGLVEGATILAPLELAPWGDKFGMLTDRFGITWLVNIAVPKG